MNCINPVILKSGLAVPCGKCDLCRSSYRNEWSVRLQLHAAAYDHMPMFICLTYNDENLTWTNEPTLVQSDVKLFLKRYKDKHNLYNTKFSYFGCGEYGDEFQRPHYHLLFFGDHELEKVFDRSIHDAEDYVNESWQKGFVDVGIAKWSGVHYVTKYVLKQIDGVVNYDDVVPQFTLCSKGLGNGWFDSVECANIKRKIQYYIDHRVSILEEVNNVLRLNGEMRNDIIAIGAALEVFEKYVPNFRVTLPSGRVAPLPRYYRRKLIGSFEHFKDNPFWFYDYLRKLRSSIEYYLFSGEYDQNARIPMSLQRTLEKLDSMHRKYLENKHRKLSRR